MKIKINGTETYLAFVFSIAIIYALNPNPLTEWCYPVKGLTELTDHYQGSCSSQHWLFTSISSEFYFS